MWKVRSGILVFALLAWMSLAQVVRARRGAVENEPFVGVWIKPECSLAAACEQLDRVKAAGFNTVFVAAFSQSRTIYPSRVAPRHTCAQTTDLLAFYLREARARDLRVIAKIETFYWEPVSTASILAGHSPLFAKHPDWRLLLRDGNPTGAAETGHNFANPAHPDVRDFLCRLCEELARRYDIDGLVLDYVRYPDGGDQDAGYDPYTRKRYRDAFGVDPIDVFRDPRRAEWRRWVWFRELQVLETVAAIRQRVKAVRPKMILSAAVFPMPAEKRYVDTRFQNWREMMSRGYLDAIMPMAYEWTLAGLADEIATVVNALPPSNEVRVWPVLAIQRKSAAGELVHPPIAEQVKVVRGLDLGGFSIFGYGWIAESEEGFEGVGKVIKDFRDGFERRLAKHHGGAR